LQGRPRQGTTEVFASITMAFVGLVTSASGKRRATTCMSSASQPGRREFLVSLAGGLVGLATWPAFAARPEGVNRPELLPKTYTTVVVC